MLHEQTGARFQTTRWTLVQALQSGDGAERERALADMSRIYWPAVYAAFRRRGCNREQAGELTQAFFAEVVLKRGLLNKAEPGNGSLRSLLRTAIGNFHADDVRRNARRRNLPDLEAMLDREEQLLSGSAATDFTNAFDRRWAVAVLEEALRRCEQHYRGQDLARNWEAFAARVIRPSCTCIDPPTLAQLATELGWDSPADAAAAVQVVKRRLLIILQEVLAEAGDKDAKELSSILGAFG